MDLVYNALIPTRKNTHVQSDQKDLSSPDKM
jgi:hypothetical protein